MLRRETAQKAIICVLLAVVMIALVAASAVAGLHASTLTAHAENEYKVLLWLADDPSTPFGSYSTTNNYKSNIKKHYESIDGVTVVEKVYSSGALTEEEISDVQLIFIIAMDANLDNQDGQYVLAASDMIKDFVDAGGRVVLSGENPNYAAPGNAVSSKLAENVGVNFTITSTMGANQEMLLNTTDKPELVKDIVAENFTPIAYAHIESTNPNAVWVMKDSENKVAVLDQAVGNGYITVITDIDWVDCGISDISDYTNGRNVANRQFLKNLLVASAENIEKNAPHVHNFSYTANGATITATCSADGCSLVGRKATLTINAPEALGYNGKVKEATLSTYDTDVFSPEAIKYYVDGAEVSAENVKDAGTYVAKVTSNGATAEVSFSIIQVNVVKWEVDDIPNVNRRISVADMDGFIPTTADIARQWVPDEDGQVILIHGLDNDYISTIVYINKSVAIVDKTSDDIVCCDLRENIEDLGIKYYYTGIREDHHHAFTYTANGATITATCSANGCSLVGGKATLTINAPEALGYNGKVKEATLSTYDTDVFSPEAIKYYVDGAEVSAENVKDAGTYVAKVTSNGATAEVSFTIIKINVVKWEIADIPAVDRRLTAGDMEGFIPTTREIAIQWLPTDSRSGQITYLIHDVGENYIAFIAYSGDTYWEYDVNYDTITCNDLRESGIVFYYTGVKENSGSVTPSKVAEPIILPEGEVENGTVTVRIFCETEGATIYYTTDGSIPNEHSTVYQPGSTVTVSANSTIRAIAMKAGMEKSVLASESFNSGAPSGNGGGTIGKGDVAPIVVKEPQKAGHGFCVGWVVFIFVMLELLYLALYFILWFPKAAFIVGKCKLTALNDFKNGHILFGVVDMLAFVGLCASCGVFLFALIALCCHACAVTVVSFILALLIFAAFVAIFVLDHKDLVKSRIDKIFKKEKKEEEPASEAEEAPAEEPASTQNDQE